MLRHLLKVGCLGVGIAGGWIVYSNLVLLFDGWVPLAATAGIVAVVFCLLYFPLARPIADAADDRLSVILHRGRHIRTGSGIEEIPDAPAPQPCKLCGGPGGPICEVCDREMTLSSKR